MLSAARNKHKSRCSRTDFTDLIDSFCISTSLSALRAITPIDKTRTKSFVLQALSQRSAPLLLRRFESCPHQQGSLLEQQVEAREQLVNEFLLGSMHEARTHIQSFSHWSEIHKHSNNDQNLNRLWTWRCCSMWSCATVSDCLWHLTESGSDVCNTSVQMSVRSVSRNVLKRVNCRELCWERNHENLISHALSCNNTATM